MKGKYAKQLLVEGNDDKHVIWNLCKEFSIVETFDVVEYGGIDNVLKNFNTLLKPSRYSTLGIIIDADENLQNRWNSLSDTLRNNGLTVPEDLPSKGLIIDGNKYVKKIGVWIMPDNKTRGMIEDFVSYLIPAEDSLKPLVEFTLDGLEASNLNRYNKDLHRSKAFIHTWLAWQEDPGRPMGVSITNRTLSNLGSAQPFIDWLNALFNS